MNSISDLGFIAQNTTDYNQDDNERIGDENNVECPRCNKLMNISNLALDGLLKPGTESACEYCGEQWEIIDVECRATVYIKKKEKKV